jgi:hypothetical protein
MTTLEQNQKPVAWIYSDAKGNNPVPVYAAPLVREWVGLTQDEILTIGKELGLKCRLGGNPNIDLDYAKVIEATLKAKNT